MRKIGAQLYTVRKTLATNEDIKHTLRAIKEIGYDSVQLFGAPYLLEACAHSAQETGLEIVGVLVDLNTCEAHERELFQICSKYHISDIGISSRFSECQDTDTYIARVNAFAAKAKNAGFTFSYHNHGHEFIRLDCGETAMDRFLKEFHAETVDFMPDTYWLHDGAYDVRYFLEQTKGRVKILHLKDMKRTEQGHTFAEIGIGNLYFKGIVKAAYACGIKHFVVEQDSCESNPIDSLRKSYKYIKTLLEN
ncbi:MAG: sugar phosphate isomerase/epimerase [Clostridia bacterium]|nr:sugar phosphate isomerase/epimerase [Clostridia bacterium]